jgi:5-keto 4-deoxyuronate isomerase
LTSEDLRKRFLVEDLFKPGRAELAYTDVDRTVVGGIAPADTPLDLQGLVVFLASEASAYVNGYTIAVDGGWLAR